MFACENCDRQFKNRSGLSGHKRMVHYSGGTSEPTTKVVQEQSTGTTPTTTEVVQRCLEEYLGERLEQQDGLLDNVLQRLDELLAAKQSDHQHDLAACYGCRGLVDEILGDNPDDNQVAVHDHGDGCLQCVAQQEAGSRRSMQRTAMYYEGLPGVTEIREQAYIGQQTITIVDWSEKVRTEDFDDATFGVVLDGMVADHRENGNRSGVTKADLARMYEEAGQRGIR